MKVKICDVCYYQNNEHKYVKSSWRLSIKKTITGEKQAIDACHKHKDYLKGLKYEEAKTKLYALYGITQ
jgi:hypothetical protein